MRDEMRQGPTRLTHYLLPSVTVSSTLEGLAFRGCKRRDSLRLAVRTSRTPSFCSLNRRTAVLAFPPSSFIHPF